MHRWSNAHLFSPQVNKKGTFVALGAEVLCGQFVLSFSSMELRGSQTAREHVN
jgi:hypothetical protein